MGEGWREYLEGEKFKKSLDEDAQISWYIRVLLGLEFRAILGEQILW